MNKIITFLLLLLISSTTYAQLTAASYRVKSIQANSENSDFGAVFFGKDKIVFSSSRGTGFTNKKWDGNDQPFLDLFIGDISANGEILNVKPFSKTVNSKYHDAMVAFSPNMKEVYFTANNLSEGKVRSNNLKIFKAYISASGTWAHVVSMPLNSDDYDSGHPTVSEDGRWLYFISNRPGGYGDTDLYKVEIQGNGYYGNPINLGPTVNSKYREYTPYVDGNVLYFSSTRPGGKGGLDIYMTKLDESIEEPINLGTPMNSSGDDFSFIINNEKQTGYFSSNRNGGKGDDDIYSFNQITVNPICDQTITGVVLDRLTGMPIPKSFVALYDEKGNKIRKKQTLNDGKYHFALKCGKIYKVVGDRPGYFEREELFSVTHVNGYEIEMNLPLEEKEFITRNGKEMLNISEIKFEINRAELLEDSKNKLLKVVRLMQKYPKMVIEFGTHTDSRGPDAYNLQLSSRRAAETVSYLISLGVDYKRITGKGYGETKLVNDCTNGVKCTDMEHLQNRRTEFVVIRR